MCRQESTHGKLGSLKSWFGDILRKSVEKIQSFTQIFREARRRIVEDIKIDESEIPVDVNMVFGLGPPLPSCKMTKSDEEDLIVALRRALELRIRGRAELMKIIMDKRK